MLRLHHPGDRPGFFSCASMMLNQITLYAREHNQFPTSINTQPLATIYKENPDVDLFAIYFQDSNNAEKQTKASIEKYFATTGTESVQEFNLNLQFEDYKHAIKWAQVAPLLHHYCVPTLHVMNYYEKLLSHIENTNKCGNDEKKPNNDILAPPVNLEMETKEENRTVQKETRISTTVQPATATTRPCVGANIPENTIAVFYRGNDKSTESKRPTHDMMYSKTRDILAQNPELQLFVQSDETEFVQGFQTIWPNAAVNPGCRTIPQQNTTIQQWINDPREQTEALDHFWGSMIFMSRCRFVICSSGNCESWVCLLRGSTDGVFQCLNDTWMS